MIASPDWVSLSRKSCQLGREVAVSRDFDRGEKVGVRPQAPGTLLHWCLQMRIQNKEPTIYILLKSSRKLRSGNTFRHKRPIVIQIRPYCRPWMKSTLIGRKRIISYAGRLVKKFKIGMKVSGGQRWIASRCVACQGGVIQICAQFKPYSDSHGSHFPAFWEQIALGFAFLKFS